MKLASLPARNLDPGELIALVEHLAAEPERWSELAAGGSGEPGRPGARSYVSLHRDDFVDVWVLGWSAEGDTGWHDHDISSGAVRVLAGALAESNPRIGGEPATRVVNAGESFSFGPDHIHRLSGQCDGALSIHAYSPPLWRLGQYSIDADGVMRRRSISYADELRPVEVAVG